MKQCDVNFKFEFKMLCRAGVPASSAAPSLPQHFRPYHKFIIFYVENKPTLDGFTIYVTQLK